MRWVNRHCKNVTGAGDEESDDDGDGERAVDANAVLYYLRLVLPENPTTRRISHQVTLHKGWRLTASGRLLQRTTSGSASLTMPVEEKGGAIRVVVGDDMIVSKPSGSLRRASR